MRTSCAFGARQVRGKAVRRSLSHRTAYLRAKHGSAALRKRSKGVWTLRFQPFSLMRSKATRSRKDLRPPFLSGAAPKAHGLGNSPSENVGRKAHPPLERRSAASNAWETSDRKVHAPLEQCFVAPGTQKPQAAEVMRLWSKNMRWARSTHGFDPRRAAAKSPGARRLPGRKAGGTPNGNRTRVAALKGRCPRPLDDGGRNRPRL